VKTDRCEMLCALKIAIVLLLSKFVKVEGRYTCVEGSKSSVRGEVCMYVCVCVYIWRQKYSVEIWSKYLTYSMRFHDSSIMRIRKPKLIFQWRHRLTLTTRWRHHKRCSVGRVTRNQPKTNWTTGEQGKQLDGFVFLICECRITYSQGCVVVNTCRISHS